MAKIFISYRREDSQHAVDRLHAGLKPHVEDPDRDIFIDVDNIPLGVDFVDHLDSKVGECEILLAVIGSDWLSIKNPATGERRIDSPKDFVRIEIAAALKRGIPVVPVLLDGAPVPVERDLPDDLKALATRHGTQISRMSFDGDVIRLARGLGLAEAHEPSEAAGSAEPPPIAAVVAKPQPVQAVGEPRADNTSGRKWPLFAGLGVGVVAIVGAVSVVMFNTSSTDTAWVEYGGIAFGDNSGEWARDGTCDDSRFSGVGQSGITSASHVMKDAADCLSAYQAGRVVLGQSTESSEITPVLTPPDELFSGLSTGVEFGDDAGDFANDGACDDARFSLTGDDYTYMRSHVMHDASDCQIAFSSGTVSLQLYFGDNSGSYAFDSSCDDNRFTGAGRSVLSGDSHVQKDASDCIAAYQAGTISRGSG